MKKRTVISGNRLISIFLTDEYSNAMVGEKNDVVVDAAALNESLPEAVAVNDIEHNKELKCDIPIVYIHLDEGNAAAVAEILESMCEKVVLAVINGVDWDKELSPWPAPKAFRSGKPFAGGADAYLHELVEEIVPAVEGSLGFAPAFRAIAGYSLAGVFAVYSLYNTGIFTRAASMSGSFWYDGFVDFTRGNKMISLPERIYLSLGDCEKVSKNPRFAAVEACTEEAEELISKLGIKTIFELNPGNHFMGVPERVAKGITWIL